MQWLLERLPVIGGCILALIVLGLMWRLDHVSGQLEAEKMARAMAEARVEEVIDESEAWVAAYWEALDEIKAQKDNAQACLDREAKARTDAVERKAILEQAKPRPRPKQEQEKVVDDETRNRVAGRLNRPL